MVLGEALQYFCFNSSTLALNDNFLCVTCATEIPFCGPELRVTRNTPPSCSPNDWGTAVLSWHLPWLILKPNILMCVLVSVSDTSADPV